MDIVGRPDDYEKIKGYLDTGTTEEALLRAGFALIPYVPKDAYS
jgi:hypothetical protein